MDFFLVDSTFNSFSQSDSWILAKNKITHARTKKFRPRKKKFTSPEFRFSIWIPLLFLFKLIFIFFCTALHYTGWLFFFTLFLTYTFQNYLKPYDCKVMLILEFQHSSITIVNFSCVYYKHYVPTLIFELLNGWIVF